MTHAPESTSKEPRREHSDGGWTPITLRPHAISTTRYDDVARLIRGERGRVLDLGCGAGQLVIALADRMDALVGVDISEARIRLANSALSERHPEYLEKVTFQRIDPTAALPFDDRSFDVVIACAVLETVPDVFATMGEIARVCRPGGCLLACVANVCYLKHVFGMLGGHIPVTWTPTRDMAQWRVVGWDGGSLRYFSREALGELLQHTGFSPESWSANGSFAKWRRWYVNLCGGLTVRARRAVREHP